MYSFFQRMMSEALRNKFKNKRRRSHSPEVSEKRKLRKLLPNYLPDGSRDNVIDIERHVQQMKTGQLSEEEVGAAKVPTFVCVVMCTGGGPAAPEHKLVERRSLCSLTGYSDATDPVSPSIQFPYPHTHTHIQNIWACRDHSGLRPHVELSSNTSPRDCHDHCHGHTSSSRKVAFYSLG